MNEEQRKKKLTIRTRPKAAEPSSPRVTGTHYVLFRFDLHYLVLKGDGVADKGNVFSVSIERGRYSINSNSASAVEDENGDARVSFDEKLNIQVALDKLDDGSFRSMDRKLTVKRKLKSSPLSVSDIGTVDLPLHAIFAAEKEWHGAQHDYVLDNCAHRGSFISLGIRYKTIGESSPLMPKNTFYPLNTSPALPMNSSSSSLAYDSRRSNSGAKRSHGAVGNIDTVGGGAAAGGACNDGTGTALLAVLLKEKAEDDQQDDIDNNSNICVDLYDDVGGNGSIKLQSMTDQERLAQKCEDQESKLRHFAALIVHLRSKLGADKRLRKEQERNSPDFGKKRGQREKRKEEEEEENEKNSSLSFLQGRLQHRKAVVPLTAIGSPSDSCSDSCSDAESSDDDEDDDNNKVRAACCTKKSITDRHTETEQQAERKTEDKEKRQRKDKVKSLLQAPRVFIGRKELEHKLKMAQRQILDQSSEIIASRAEVATLRNLQRQLCSAALDNVTAATATATVDGVSPNPSHAYSATPLGEARMMMMISADTSDISNNINNNRSVNPALHFPLSPAERAALLNEQVYRDNEIMGLLHEENEELKMANDGLKKQIQGYQRQVQILNQTLQHVNTKHKPLEQEGLANQQRYEGDDDRNNEHYRDRHNIFQYHRQEQQQEWYSRTHGCVMSDLELLATDSINSHHDTENNAYSDDEDDDDNDEDIDDNDSKDSNSGVIKSELDDDGPCGGEYFAAIESINNRHALTYIREEEEEEEEAEEAEYREKDIKFEERHRNDKQTIETLESALRSVSQQLITYDATYRQLETVYALKMTQKVERLSKAERALFRLVKHITTESHNDSNNNNNKKSNRNRNSNSNSIGTVGEIANMSRGSTEDGGTNFNSSEVDAIEIAAAAAAAAVGSSSPIPAPSLAAAVDNTGDKLNREILDLRHDLVDAHSDIEALNELLRDKVIDMQEMRALMFQQRETIDNLSAELSSKETHMALSLLELTSKLTVAEKRVSDLTSMANERENQMSNTINDLQGELEKSKQTMDFIVLDANTRIRDMQIELSTVSKEKRKAEKALRALAEKEQQLSDERIAAQNELRRAEEEHTVSAALLLAAADTADNKEQIRGEERLKEEVAAAAAAAAAADKRLTHCKDSLKEALQELDLLKSKQNNQQKEHEELQQQQKLLLLEKSRLLNDANNQLKKAEKKVRSLTASLAEAATEAKLTPQPTIKEHDGVESDENHKHMERRRGEHFNNVAEEAEKNEKCSELSVAQDRALKAEAALASKEEECDSILQELINVKMEFAMLSASMG